MSIATLLDADSISLLQTIIVMAGLHLVMMIWMGAARLPAMRAAKIHPQKAAHTSDMVRSLPGRARQVGDNYNHLFEAPTIFYALVITIVLLGHVDAVHLVCAWSYVGLRILHSLVQATINVVMIRFPLFVLSWVVMGVMIVRELMALV